MFALYPLYLPIYLAEYTDTVDDRRVTCVAFANQASPVSILTASFLYSSRTDFLTFVDVLKGIRNFS